MLTGRFARESIHPKLFRSYVSRFAPLFLKPEKVREKTCGSTFSSENFTQIISKIDTIAAVRVDFMYRAAYVHSFSISYMIAGSFLISFVADCCLPSGESTYVQTKQLCANRFSGETTTI